MNRARTHSSSPLLRSGPLQYRSGGGSIRSPCGWSGIVRRDRPSSLSQPKQRFIQCCENARYSSYVSWSLWLLYRKSPLQGGGVTTGLIPACGIADVEKRSSLMIVACPFREKNPLFTLCPFLYRRSSLPYCIAFRPLKITGTLCADPVDTNICRNHGYPAYCITCGLYQ